MTQRKYKRFIGESNLKNTRKYLQVYVLKSNKKSSTTSNAKVFVMKLKKSIIKDI